MNRNTIKIIFRLLLIAASLFVNTAERIAYPLSSRSSCQSDEPRSPSWKKIKIHRKVGSIVSILLVLSILGTILGLLLPVWSRKL